MFETKDGEERNKTKTRHDTHRASPFASLSNSPSIFQFFSTCIDSPTSLSTNFISFKYSVYSNSRAHPNMNKLSTSRSIKSSLRPTKGPSVSPQTKLKTRSYHLPNRNSSAPSTPTASPTPSSPPGDPTPNNSNGKIKFNLIRAEKTPLSSRKTSKTHRRVVVTGIGVVSPLGNQVDDMYTRILQGYSAITSIEAPELVKLNLQAKSYAPVGVIPELEDPEIIPRHLKQVLSRHQVYAMVAAHKAMLSANLLEPKTIPPDSPSTTPNITDPTSSAACNLGHDSQCDLCEGEPSCAYMRDSSDRLGVCIGNSIGCVEEIGASHVKIQEKGGKGAGAYSLPKLLVNLAAGHIAQQYQARALTHTVSTACATGAHAIGDAMNFIRNDQADIIIAGGTETGVSPLSLALFNRIHALSRQPASSSGGPFTKERDGFVMGEGAAILILESLDSAKKRNANILCEVLGYGISADAYHITQPHKLGRGAFMAMENALNDADIDMTFVDYVNMHATSTPIGDISEASAIRALTQTDYTRRKNKMAIIDSSTPNKSNNLIQSTNLTKLMTKPPIKNQLFSRPLVSSTKGHVGHLLGAAGALEAAISVMAIKTNTPPPTVLRTREISPNIPVNVLSFDKDLDSTLPKITIPEGADSHTSSPSLRPIQPANTLWESIYATQFAGANESIKPLKDLEDGVDYYTNEQGYLVFTEKYHIDKGYCCENACKHCPYDFNKDKQAEMKNRDLLKGELDHNFAIDVVLSNSFGFGGANASLVFGRYTDSANIVSQ